MCDLLTTVPAVLWVLLSLFFVQSKTHIRLISSVHMYVLLHFPWPGLAIKYWDDWSRFSAVWMTMQSLNNSVRELRQLREHWPRLFLIHQPIPVSRLQFCCTTSRDHVAVCNSACRTLQLCCIRKNWPISLVSSCLCDKVAACYMHSSSCILQLGRTTNLRDKIADATLV